MSIQVAQQIVQQPLEALLPYARNSRTHSDEQVAQIAASIREFGFTNPVLVDGANGIVAGHGRVMAAKLLGLAEAPTVNVGWMTEAQRRAYVIADNQIALNAGWDMDALAAEMADLDGAGFDLAVLGLDADELDAIMGEGEPEAEPAAGAAPSAGITYQEQFAVLVGCADERAQEAAFNRLSGMGYACKVLVN